MTFRKVSLLFGFIIAIPGCNNQPTYHGDIETIMQKHCNQCHQDGGIAPFSLTSFKDVKALAPVINQQIKTRQMPPFVANNSGSCKTYKDARWMSDEEIDLVEQWTNSSQLKGTAPQKPVVVPKLEFVEADYTLQTPAWTPNDSPDNYRCFIIDHDFQTTKYITGTQVRPGSPKMAHHMLLFAIDGEGNYEAVVDKDNNDPGPGFDCINTPAELLLDGSRLVGEWAPGIPYKPLPSGTGIRIDPTTKFVVQMHYNTLNIVEEDTTSIDLTLSDSVEKELFVQLLDDGDLEVPGGKKAVSYTTSFRLNHPIVRAFFNIPKGGIDVLGIGPHMHQKGIKLTTEYKDSDGQSHCLQQVDDWDFNWQEFFLFDGPAVHMESDGQLSWTCTYDTTGLTQPLYWGEGTEDEMCMIFLLYTISDQ